MADKGRYFKINDFIANIQSKGVLKTNRYEVYINIPGQSPLNKIIKNLTGLNNYEQLLSLRCDTVQMPGMALATIDGFLRYGYGAPETVPYAAIMDSLSASFIIDTNSRIHMFFYHWVNFITNYRVEGQKDVTAAWNLIGGSRPYELSYRTDYAATMEITVFDDATNEWTIKTTAYNVYPKAIPQVDLSYSAENELMKLTIPFAYSDYKVEYNYQMSRENTDPPRDLTR